MDVGELREAMDQVQLIDVRDAQEFGAGHLDGARHIPLEELRSRPDAVDPARPVITVCRTGVRSQTAADFLCEAGIDAVNLEGGVVAWTGEGHPLVDSQGRPGRVLHPGQDDAQPAEFAELQGSLIEVAYGLQERYGNREPTDEEARSFMREWLQGKGRSEEEIDRILAD